MKNIYIIIIIFLALILSIYGNVKFQNTEPVVGYLNIFVQITNYSDIKIQEDSVYFYSPAGRQMSGSTLITNNQQKINKIKIFVEGEIRDWLIIEEKEFKLEPQQTKKINIIINIPLNTQGNYEGKLRIETR